MIEKDNSEEKWVLRGINEKKKEVLHLQEIRTQTKTENVLAIVSLKLKKIQDYWQEYVKLGFPAHQ